METKIKNAIRILTRSYYIYQKERMMLDGQLGLTKDGSKKKRAPERDEDLIINLMRRRKDVYECELTILSDLKAEVHRHPLWDGFLRDCKGCGETMAAVIITEVDIARAIHVSNLWSYAGLAPGKDRRVKGQKCTYNQFLKSKLVGVLAGSFLRTGSPYAEHYYNMRNRLESAERGNVSENPTNKGNPRAGHQHNMALRYAVKMFLRDLYVAWRELEGLPVSRPYQEKYLGHVHHDSLSAGKQKQSV